MSSVPRIEPRTEEDVDAVRALLEHEEISTERLEQSVGFVVRDEAQVIGHLAVERLGEGYAVLNFLVLAERYRGRGVTNQLVSRVERWARDQGIRELIVFTNLDVGIRWVTERGFHEIDPRRIPERVRTWSLFGTPVIAASKAFRRPVISGVLFLGETNAARTLIAEGLARKSAPGGVAVYSAGLVRSDIDPLAPRALREVDLDPEGLHAKPLEAVPLEEVNFLVSFDRERSSVLPEPLPPIHEVIWEIHDPKVAPGDENTRLMAFRHTRDEIHKRLVRFFG